MRVVKASTAVVDSPVFVSDDQETPQDCASDPTCAVTRESGTSLTAPTITNLTDRVGVYTATLTAGTHTSQLDRLAVVWTGTVDSIAQVYRQQIEVVGGHYVTIPEIRAEPDMSDPKRYPKAQLMRWRDDFAELAEDYCDRAFVRRYNRETLRGNGTDRLLLAKRNVRSVISVTVDDVAQTTTEFEIDPMGFLIWTGESFDKPDTDLDLNVVVEYEWGDDAAPEQLSRACLTYIRTRALQRGTQGPTDAISESFDGRQVRYSTPNRAQGRPTGILTVDSVLNDLREWLPAVG